MKELERLIVDKEYYHSKLSALESLRSLLEGDQVNIGEIIRHKGR